MIINPQPARTRASANPSLESVDPVYQQIRDLVYKVSGIYKADDKLYLLADGCGRRMKLVGVRTPREYWDRLTASSNRDAELRELLNAISNDCIVVLFSNAYDGTLICVLLLCYHDAQVVEAPNYDIATDHDLRQTRENLQVRRR